METMYDILNEIKRAGFLDNLITLEEVSKSGCNIPASEESDILILQDCENYYIDLNYGLGFGEYPKDSFTLQEAIDDACNDHLN